VWFRSVTCLHVLHPYIAHCQYLLTGGSFYRLSGYQCYEPLTLLIFMSHRVSLVKSSPRQIRALQLFFERKANLNIVVRGVVCICDYRSYMWLLVIYVTTGHICDYWSYMWLLVINVTTGHKCDYWSYMWLLVIYVQMRKEGRSDWYRNPEDKV